MSTLNFTVGDKVVYPSHGVGEIVDIESQVIATTKLEVYVISFPQDKMTLRVPVSPDFRIFCWGQGVEAFVCKGLRFLGTTLN